MPPKLPPDITALVLAGGKSSRMGSNKLTMKISEMRIIEHVILTMSHIYPTYVAGKDNLPHYIDDERFISDILPISTPLVGLYSGLRVINSDVLFLISGDMPFARKDLILFLKSMLSKEIAAVVPFYKRPQTTFAFYKKSCLQTVSEAIKNGRFSLKGLLKEIKVKYVYEQEMRSFDHELISFFNINTKEQLKVGKRLFATMQCHQKAVLY